MVVKLVMVLQKIGFALPHTLLFPSKTHNKKYRQKTKAMSISEQSQESRTYKQLKRLMLQNTH
jgi:hypothetical protein